MIDYGIIKNDIAVITDASVQYLRDADLGLMLKNQKSQSVSPLKGAIESMELIELANQGDGYSSGTNQPSTGIMTSNNDSGNGSNLKLSSIAAQNDQIIFAATATSGTGTGATFIGTTIYNIGSLVANLPFSFGAPASTPNTPGGNTTTTTQDGTSKAITGTAPNGANGRFIVTAVGGIVTKVIQEARLPNNTDMQGNGYIIGEPISLSKAAMDADGGLGVVGGPITFFPTIDHVTNGAHIIKVLNGGSGYSVRDTIRLTQISPVQKGFPVNSKLATVAVKTLGPAIDTPGEIKIYPAAIKNIGAGAQVINILNLEGILVSLGTLQPGELIPVSFTQVEGTTPATVGTVQILYS